jgi:hypothetical protein
MGCDIHIFIEYYDTEDGKWKIAAYDKETGETTPGRAITIANGDDGYIRDIIWDCYRIRYRRDYRLFTKLADVRDYSSWGVVPIAKPRNLPENVNNFIREGHLGHHSLTHFTPEELLAVDWKTSIIERTYVARAVFDSRLDSGRDIDAKDTLRCVPKYGSCISSKGYITLPEDRRLSIDYVEIETVVDHHLDQNSAKELLKLCRDLKATDKSWRIVIGFDS